MFHSRNHMDQLIPKIYWNKMNFIVGSSQLLRSNAYRLIIKDNLMHGILKFSILYHYQMPPHDVALLKTDDERWVTCVTNIFLSANTTVGNLMRIVYGIIRASWLLRPRTNILPRFSHRKSRISSQATNIIGRMRSRTIPYGAYNNDERNSVLSHISADTLISPDTMNSIAAISQCFSQLKSIFSQVCLIANQLVLLFRRRWFVRSAASMRMQHM